MRDFQKELDECNARIEAIQILIADDNQKIEKLMERPNLKHLKVVK